MIVNVKNTFELVPFLENKKKFYCCYLGHCVLLSCENIISLKIPKQNENYMKNKFIKYLVYFSVLFFMISGCSHTKKVVNSIQPLKFNIVIGTGGGFSGLYEGKIIDTSGIIYEWKGRTYLSAAKNKIGSISREKIAKINSLFLQDDIFSYSFKESGNLINFLTVTKGNQSTTFTWRESTSNNKLPEKIYQLYNLVIESTK
ncbi:MAG: hypothetical protein Fur0015_05050 [Ignavibacteriales bacterium]